MCVWEIINLPAGHAHAAFVAWIYTSGAYHTGYCQNLTSENMEDFDAMANIDYISIGTNTELYQFKNKLRWSGVYYQINNK